MIIVVSGQIAVGKTSLAHELALRGDGEVVRVREALAQILGLRPDDRVGMQAKGIELDQRTNGRWLAEHVAELAEREGLLIVDSARTVRQTRPLLEGLTDSRMVFIRAHESTRRARYIQAASLDPMKAAVPFDTAMTHPTEALVTAVAPLAHVVVETDDLDTRDAADEVQRQLSLEW